MGHYSTALAAKVIEPRAPLWSYMVAAELLDFGFSGLIMGGVERFRIDPSLPGAPLDLFFMPWTHSLGAAVVWAVLAAVFAFKLLRLPPRAATLIGLVAFSHWGLDLLVHRPDLPLMWDGPKVGFGLWNAPVLAEAVEMGLLGLSAAAYAGWRGANGLRPWPALGLFGVLIVLQVISLVVPMPPDTVSMGLTFLAVYLTATVAAGVAERGPRVKPQGPQPAH